MKAKEITKNGNWYLLIKDGRKTVATISKPNELNFNHWNLSLYCGVSYTYEEYELHKLIKCADDVLSYNFGISLHRITDEKNYPADLLICLQD